MAASKKPNKKELNKRSNYDSKKYIYKFGKAILFIIGVFFGLSFFASMSLLSCHSSGGFCATDFDQGLATQTFFLGFVSTFLIVFSVTKNKKMIILTLSIFIVIALLAIFNIKSV